MKSFLLLVEEKSVYVYVCVFPERGISDRAYLHQSDKFWQNGWEAGLIHHNTAHSQLDSLISLAAICLFLDSFFFSHLLIIWIVYDLVLSP